MPFELILQYGSPLLTMLIGWLIGLKVQRAQVKANELENVQQAIGIYRKLAEDLESKLAIADQRVNELSNRLEQMQRQVNAIARKCNSNCFKSQ